MAAHQHSACNGLWIIKQMACLCRGPPQREISARATAGQMTQEKGMLLLETGSVREFLRE